MRPKVSVRLLSEQPWVLWVLRPAPRARDSLAMGGEGKLAGLCQLRQVRFVSVVQHLLHPAVVTSGSDPLHPLLFCRHWPLLLSHSGRRMN